MAHLHHYWVSTPSHLRGPPAPPLGIHSQPFTWPRRPPLRHYWVSNPAVYVAHLPLLGIHSQPFPRPAPASTACGYPLPAIYVAPFCHYWVSNPATAATAWVYTPSHLRGPAGPGSATTGYPTQPFTWPICRYWVSTPSHPRPVSATTGYPLPVIYVAHRGGPSLLWIHPPPFTWPVSGPPIAGNHSHPIDHFPPLGGPLAAHVQLRLTRRRCGRQ